MSLGSRSSGLFLYLVGLLIFDLSTLIMKLKFFLSVLWIDYYYYYYCRCACVSWNGLSLFSIYIHIKKVEFTYREQRLLFRFRFMFRFWFWFSWSSCKKQRHIGYSSLVSIHALQITHFSHICIFIYTHHTYTLFLFLFLFLWLSTIIFYLLLFF